MTMPKGQNYNAPQKGTKTKGQPIRDITLVRKIKHNLRDHPRNYALFVVVINTGLRANELLSITAGQVRYINEGEEIRVWQKKTKKYRILPINKTTLEACQALLNSRKYEDDDYLFYGRGGKGALTIESYSYLVKTWCKAVGLEGYSSHDLRRTFAYQKFKSGVSLSHLREALGHSSEWQTRQYISIESEDVRTVYDKEL